MPFPWKKAKVNRISRLVADLHQSPKHGGSLVVETGFPTSLIDLFHKNRDRLRKSPRRKSSSSCSPQIQTPPPLPPSSPPKSFPSPPPCKDELLSPKIDAGELQSPEIDGGELVFVKRECEERIAFLPAFKIFLMVALAVSTRSLAVWVMMAAFLLVLIEIVGALFFGFLRPESKMLFLDSRILKGLLVLKRREQGSAPELAEKQPATVFSDSCQSIELEDNCAEEIQIAEPEFDSVDEGRESESLGTQTKGEEMEKRREILICASEPGKRARIKAKLIKKFVPKKLRNGKKQGKSNDKDDRLDEIEEEKQGSDPDDNREDEAQAEGEGSCKRIEEVGGRISTCVQHLWVENDRKRKSGYLILFVIVLAGLVGGRGLALSLTLLWCLIVRYIGRLKEMLKSNGLGT